MEESEMRNSVYTVMGKVIRGTSSAIDLTTYDRIQSMIPYMIESIGREDLRHDHSVEDNSIECGRTDVLDG